MNCIGVTICALVFSASAVYPQNKSEVKKPSAEPVVELEMMTWPELKKAIHEENKTTALIYNGGTEQRGPQNITGGHTFMGQATARAIAERLGNTIVAPVLPFSVNNASADLPGTIGLTGPLFAAVNEEVAEQLIRNGFKNIVLMGDHGGGQQELGEVAKKLDQKYSSQGIRVASVHGGVPDTSEMIYLGGDKGWVRRELVSTALGDPPLKPGQNPDPNAMLINNGITGDARRSSAALGKRRFDMKVEYAVNQIQRLLSRAPAL